MIEGPYYNIICNGCGTKIVTGTVKEATKHGWNILRNNHKQVIRVFCPACAEGKQ